MGTKKEVARTSTRKLPKDVTKPKYGVWRLVGLYSSQSDIALAYERVVRIRDADGVNQYVNEARTRLMVAKIPNLDEAISFVALRTALQVLSARLIQILTTHVTPPEDER